MSFLKYNVYKLMGVPTEDMGKRFKGGGKQRLLFYPTSTERLYKLLKGAGSWLSQGGFDNYGGELTSIV